MKITKNQLRQIIREEATKLQKKTILENRRQDIVNELRMLNEDARELLVYKMENGKKTDDIVGTHQYGKGFTPNELGKKLGFKPHPTSIPNQTIIDRENSEDLYENLAQKIVSGEPYKTHNVPLESYFSKEALFLMSLLNKDSKLDFEKILKNNNVQFSSQEKYNILNDFLEGKDKSLKDEVGEFYSISDVDFLVDVRDKFKKEAEGDLNESIRKIVREGIQKVFSEEEEYGGRTFAPDVHGENFINGEYMTGKDLETMPKSESIPILTKWWESLGPQNRFALFMGYKSLEEKAGITKGFNFQDPETLDIDTIAQIYFSRKFIPLTGG
jgi:hypothetical protein